MAIQNTAQWWIRTDGDDTNGGGYDSGISGAGTNYSDQATAQLSLTDLATASVGSTTLTSATGGFTASMVGNAIKLRSGTNASVGYYFITAHTDTNTVTIDRACDDGAAGLSGGSGKLGGAWGDVETSITTQATALGNSCASPVIAGNQVNIQGSGVVDPATPDYTFSSYRFLPTGNTTDGWITLVGYNGTPSILAFSSQGGLIFYQLEFAVFENMKFVANGPAQSNLALITGNSKTKCYRCIFDLNGHAVKGAQASCTACYFKNSGAAAACVGIRLMGYNQTILGNVFDLGSSATAVIGRSAMGSISNNLFIGGSYGIDPQGYQYVNHTLSVTHNTFAGCTTGVKIWQYGSSYHRNLFANCTTAFEPETGREALPPHTFIENAFYNVSTKYLNFTKLGNGGVNDINLSVDPFTDYANGDYSLKSSSDASSVDVYADIPGYSGATSNYQAIGAVKTLLPDVDTRFEDVQDGDSFYPFRHLVADDFYEDPPAEGTSDDFVRTRSLAGRHVYEFSIGSGEGRDYSSLTDFFADFDDTLINIPKSRVIVTCHNDTGTDEAVIEDVSTPSGLYITNPSNCEEFILTVADDSWHKGEFGKGCVIRASAPYYYLVNMWQNSGKCRYWIERLALDGNGQSYSNQQQHLLYNQISATQSPFYVTFSDLLIQGSSGASYGPSSNGAYGIRSGAYSPTLINNCVVRNVFCERSGKNVNGMNLHRNSVINNCAVYNISNTVEPARAIGLIGVTAGTVKDSIVMSCGGDCVSASTVTVSNVVTDDSTGDLQSSAAAEFLDAANGDFRLRSGAVSAGIGPQLTDNCQFEDITGKPRSSVSGVTTDAGPFNNIAGYDQEVRFPTEAGTSATEENVNDGTRIYPLRQFVEANFQGDSPPIHPLRST